MLQNSNKDLSQRKKLENKIENENTKTGKNTS